MTRKDIFRLLTLFLVIASASCVEEFYPDINGRSESLVVDGKITNEPGPYEIRLFTPSQLNETTTFNPKTGAFVVIHDDQGNSDNCDEISPGVYQNESPEFKGEVGRSYWIEIETAEGEKYESIPEVMPPVIEIDTIYAEEVNKRISKEEFEDRVEVYFDGNDSSNTVQYIRWEYWEAWEWHTYRNIAKSEHPSYICYPNDRSSLVQIFDARFLQNKKITKLPTAFISEADVKLNHSYYIYINLYSINPGAYKFWNTIKETVQNSGSIYDAIPSKLVGNIESCNQDNPPVLGYFQVCSIQRKGKEFHNGQFSIQFPFLPKECKQLKSSDRPDPAIYHLEYIKYDPVTEKPWYFSRPNFCFDCSLKYPVSKPSFWP